MRKGRSQNHSAQVAHGFVVAPVLSRIRLRGGLNVRHSGKRLTMRNVTASKNRFPPPPHVQDPYPGMTRSRSHIAGFAMCCERGKYVEMILTRDSSCEVLKDLIYEAVFALGNHAIVSD